MSREVILARIRTALAAPTAHHPDRPSPAPPAPTAVPESTPLERLRQRAQALGVHWHATAGVDALAETVASLADRAGLVWVTESGAPGFPADALARRLKALGTPVVRNPGREEAGRVTIGVTGADVAIAESASLVICPGRGRGRLPSVLPPIHVAVLSPGTVVDTLAEALARIAADFGPASTSAALLISGPSRTGDIEGRLVVGVHGPGAVHLALLS